MDWFLLIVAGLFESGFAFCLGKMKEAAGTEWYLWGAGFLACVVISMLLLAKAVHSFCGGAENGLTAVVRGGNGLQKAAGYVGRQGGLGGSEGEREESGTVCGSGWYRRYEEGKRLPQGGDADFFASCLAVSDICSIFVLLSGGNPGFAENRSIRLTVRTADSHSANTSSILVWSTEAGACRIWVFSFGGLLRTVVGVGLFEYLRGRMDGDGWRKRF